MLDSRQVRYRFRDYREQPLSATELRRLLARLGRPARELLRRRDRAFRELGLTGEETEDRLLRCLAGHPTLLERPIGVLGRRAVIGRPPEALLTLIGEA